jgi:hypothetical protein
LERKRKKEGKKERRKERRKEGKKESERVECMWFVVQQSFQNSNFSVREKRRQTR